MTPTNAHRSDRRNHTIPIVIEAPAASDDFKLEYMARGMNVTSIICQVDPGDTTESVVVVLEECTAAQIPGTDCTTVESVTCANAETTSGTIDAPSIAVGNSLALNLGTVTGTVTFLTYTIVGTRGN